MKRILCCVLSAVIAMVCVSACAEDGRFILSGKPEASIPIRKDYGNNPVVSGVSSTTGLPVSGEAYTPIVMVLDNAEDAHPHWGISQADILFQIPNAGKGATKLLALFADHYPEQAGGARSARATMIPVATAWGAAFAYAGGATLKSSYVDVQTLLKKWKMTGKLSYNLLGNKYKERVDFIDSPHNLSCHVREIHDYLVSKKVGFSERPFLFTDTPLSRGDDVSAIEIRHYGDAKEGHDNPASRSRFTYDAARNAYIRSNSSGDFIDRDTGEPVPFSNVIVLTVQVKWAEGYLYLGKHLVGSGTAQIFQNGKHIEGAWARTSDTGRLVLLDEQGNELEMQRGKSFIVITNDVTEIICNP